MPPQFPELLQAVVEGVSEVIFHADGFGRWKYLNPAWTRLTGYSLEESLELPFLAVFDLQGAWDGLASGAIETIREECTITLKNSQRRWVELSATRYEEPDGAFAGVVGTITDIEPRKLRDTTIMDIRRALLQPDLPAAFQTITNAIQCNLQVAACRIWSYHPAEKQVRLWASAGSDDIEDGLHDELAIAVAMQGSPVFRSRQPAAAFPIFNGLSLEAVLAIFSFSEISSQLKQTVGSLAAEVGQSLERRDGEEKFRAVFYHSSEPMLLTDETGIFDCNQAALDVFGCTLRAPLLGHHPAEFSPEFQPDGTRSVEKRRAVDRRVLEQGAQRFEWMFRDSRGRDIPMEVNITLVTLGGRPTFLALFHNIETRKAYERELEQAKEQSESADRAKSAFIARVSDQVRAPLNGIRNAAHFLEESELPNKQRILVESIGKTSRDLLTLVNDALDLSRMQAGDLRLLSAPFDLRLAIEDVLELLTPKADAKGIDLVLHYSWRLPRRAVGDAGRVRQILIHTVEQAILWTDHGHVAIRIEAPPSPENRLRVAVTIEDTGAIIPADRHNALFEGLTDSGATGEARLAGKGLGLPLARKLVEYMGGTLFLTSVPGQGNRCAYEILLDRDMDEWPARRPSVEAVKRRVLLVGPDNLVRAGIVQTLRDWGLQPRVTSTADEALPWFNPGSTWLPDLVLVSSRMSGMSWEDFGRRVMEITVDAKPTMVLFVRSSETVLSPEALQIGWDSATVRNVRMGALLDLLEHTPGHVVAASTSPAPDVAIRRSILVATDDPETLFKVSCLAVANNFSCNRAGSLEDAAELAKQRRHELTFIDFERPTEQLAQAVEKIRTSLLDCTIPVVVIAPARIPLPGCEWLAKPILPNELDRLLIRLTSRPTVQVFNRFEFIERCGGDLAMAHELSEAFRGLLPLLMGQLREAAGLQNAAAVRQCSRRMRAAAALFSADPLAKACDRLMEATELRDWAAVPAVASVVKAEASRLAAQLPANAPVREEIPA